MGGAESLIMNIYRKIDRNKIQFDFIKHDDNESSFDQEIFSLGGKIYYAPKYRGTNHFEYVKYWKKFFTVNKEYKIIHGHVRSTASIYLYIARKFGLKTISHSHSTSSGNGIEAFIKNVLQYPIRYISDYFFACSKDAGKWLFGDAIVKNKNFYIINNAIDAKKYIYNPKIRKEIRNIFNITDEFVLGHVGRFVYPKNHDFILDIFTELKKIKYDSKLFLVGEGELKKDIEEKVRLLGLSESVIFTGERSDVHNLMQSFDAFVLPSIYEGLGIVAIEAQTAGLFTVVSQNIPKETNLTKNIKYMSLEDSSKKWADEIFRGSSKSNKDTFNDVIKMNYDINKVSKDVMEIYLEMYNKGY